MQVPSTDELVRFLDSTMERLDGPTGETVWYAKSRDGSGWVTLWNDGQVGFARRHPELWAFAEYV